MKFLKSQKLNLTPSQIEAWYQLPYDLIIGTDEVGRGCLAGPVVSCAVKFNSLDELADFKDSKSLSEARREKLFEAYQSVLTFGVGLATVEEIDDLNILQASLLSMKRALEALQHKAFKNKPDFNASLKLASSKLVLLDGNQVIPNLLGYDQAPIIKGDQRVSLISAASVMAKVYRDRLMKTMALELPGYGFEIHKGYATALHRSAIEEKGPSKWHRLSFRGVKEYVL